MGHTDALQATDRGIVTRSLHQGIIMTIDEITTRLSEITDEIKSAVKSGDRDLSKSLISEAHELEAKKVELENEIA